MSNKYVIYTRVSDEGQLDNSSLASQERLAIEWGTAQGWQHVETIRDQGSRDTLERVHTERLFTLLGQKKSVDTVLIYRVDRAGGESEVFSRLFGRIYSANATVAIVEKRRHYENLIDLMHDTVFDRAVSEYELFNIRKRTSQGTIDHLERGSFLTVPLYGYTLRREMRDGININVPQVDNEKAKVIRYIISTVAGGGSVTTLGKEMNERGIPGPKSPRWNETTLRNIVGRYGEKYAGQPWTYNRRVNKTKTISVTYTYPAIVTLEEVIAARQSLKSHCTSKLGTLPFNKGLITCEHCGKTAAIRRIKSKHLTTVCNSYTTAHAYRIRGLPVDFEMCPRHLSLAVIQQRLREWLRGEGEDSLDRAVQKLQARLISTRLYREQESQKYREAEQQKRNLVTKLLDSSGAEYQSIRDAINERMQEADETMVLAGGITEAARKDEQRILSTMDRLGIVPVGEGTHTGFHDLTGSANIASFEFHARVGALIDAVERQDPPAINREMRQLGLRIRVNYMLPDKDDRANSIKIDLDPTELAGLSQQTYQPFDVPPVG